MNNKQAVSGSIVLYKSTEDVVQAIQSFLNSPLTLKLYLIDNSPTNALQITLRQILLNNRVEYIFNHSNMGYGAAHNIAIRKSLAEGYQYHFVLNPDVYFESEVISSICNYIEANPDVGLVMPKILYDNGELQYLCKLLPTPFDLFFRRFLPDSFINKRTDTYELRQTGYNTIMEVPFLSGCFMALRKEAIEQCGMFDERFFMYGEDIDFSRRIHQKFRTIFYPHVSIVHGYEASSYKSLKMLKIHAVNIIRYFNKWGWWFDDERKEINKKIIENNKRLQEKMEKIN